MAQDTNKAFEKHQDKLLKQELKDFAKHVFGPKRKRKARFA